ncbi:hypothetical protein BGZ81_005605 [Podila clonocystis]|nr:hypothetical protein BGZ81_005605 [Podila clonocystis]
MPHTTIGHNTSIHRKEYPKTCTKASSSTSMTLRQLLGLLAVASISVVSTADPIQGDPPTFLAVGMVGHYMDHPSDVDPFDEMVYSAERTTFLPLRYNLQPTSASVIRERYERVRGKGTQTTLKTIQAPMRESRVERNEREMRLRAVRRGFEHAWQGYRKHAWGHDEVKPVSGAVKDTFNGWGATLVDSLDTLLIMGFNQEFDEAVEWIRTSLVMNKNPTMSLPFFETAIRYLGGFLSAYDLSGEQVLLDKAQELGGYLLNAFQFGVFPTGKVAVDVNSNHRQFMFVLAEIGTIQVEFTRLSKLMGNPLYEQKARDVIDTINNINTELPGLYPSLVGEGSTAFSSYSASVGGQADSFYEYLLKEWILLDGKSDEYRDMYLRAIDTIEQYMVTRPESGSQEYAIIGSIYSKDKRLDPQMEHLGCFMAGSLAMSSKYFDRPQDLVLARRVAESCFLTYRHSVTGLGPENFRFDAVNSEGTIFKVDPDTFYNRDRSAQQYILRPETIESLWILYRTTGQKKYQDQAWEMFQSLERNCRTNIAYSGLLDVNKPGSYDDRMESFFMAETMKYYYLIFSTPDVISLDNFVLNTEAHPIRRT